MNELGLATLFDLAQGTTASVGGLNKSINSGKMEVRFTADRALSKL
jgi:hypothetical protein